jgi:hypothetical protein
MTEPNTLNTNPAPLEVPGLESLIHGMSEAVLRSPPVQPRVSPLTRHECRSCSLRKLRSAERRSIIQNQNHQRLSVDGSDAFTKWRNGRRLQSWGRYGNPTIGHVHGLFLVLYSYEDGHYELLTSAFEQPTLGWRLKQATNTSSAPFDVLAGALGVSMRSLAGEVRPDFWTPRLTARVRPDSNGVLDLTITTFLAESPDRTFHWLLEPMSAMQALESRLIWEGEFRFRKQCLVQARKLQQQRQQPAMPQRPQAALPLSPIGNRRPHSSHRFYSRIPTPTLPSLQPEPRDEAHEPEDDTQDGSVEFTFGSCSFEMEELSGESNNDEEGHPEF